MEKWFPEFGVSCLSKDDQIMGILCFVITSIFTLQRYVNIQSKVIVLV